MLVFKSHVWYSAMIHTDSQSDMQSCWLLFYVSSICNSYSLCHGHEIYTVHIAVEDFMGVLKSPNRFKNPPQGPFG